MPKTLVLLSIRPEIYAMPEPLDNDPLSEVLQSIRINGKVYSPCQFSAPWGLSASGCSGHALFYIVSRGSALLEVEDSPAITLTGGDLVLLPQGTSHTLRDAPGSPVVAIETLVDFENPGPITFGGGGLKSTMVAGCFTFEFSANHPFIDSLPPVMHLTAEDVETEPWLNSTFQFLLHEASQPRQGSSLVISRLTDLLFIQIMRTHIQRIKDCPASNGWLKALADPQISQAIRLMHKQPDAPWTVAALADKVGMSRSAFAQKFSQYTKTTPVDYLTFWRMEKAKETLNATNKGLAEISQSVGYQSEAAFSKAFRRVVGTSPGAFRHSNARA
ncbi:AraC family transcriptional regulator [soil metagenome]